MTHWDLPAVGGVLGRMALRLFGFRSRMLPGGIHMMERPGRRGDLLLIHGIGAEMAHWIQMVVFLGRRHTVRMIDLPGHGASDGSPCVDLEEMTEVITRAVETLPPSVVVGNSLGGAVALHLAVHLPDHVQGLFLISPAGPPMDEPTFQSVVGQFELQTTAQARQFLRKLFAGFPWNSGLLAPFVATTFRRASFQRLRTSLRNQGALTVEQAHALRVPVHMSWGDKDGVLPKVLRDWLIEHVPALQRADAADEALEAHSPQVERPRSMARRILRFASTVEAFQEP